MNKKLQKNQIKQSSKKSIFTSFLFLLFALNSFYLKAETNNNVDGFWILTSIEAGDTTVNLDKVEKELRTSNYLKDFPLKTTTLSFKDNNFVLTHHNGSQVSGTFEILDNSLILHFESCNSCGNKDLYFIIHSHTEAAFVVDLFDEDEWSSSYVRLNFSNKFFNN